AGVSSLRVSEPSLVRWLHERKADAVVLRPDGFVYAATSSGQPMPAPPAGLNLTTLTGAPA
ncbi:MAG: FAD-binding monooxygenase, partial [Actinobacteria bacterium]|nr:FAD-binding monooxygenase [Actinomycetota bacterium]